MATACKKKPKRPMLDPPVRKDGRCYVCRGERPSPEDPRGIYKTYLDPFCSAKCCREYWGVSFDIPTKQISRDMSRKVKK